MKKIFYLIFTFFLFSTAVFSDNHKTNFKDIKGYKEKFLSMSYKKTNRIKEVTSKYKVRNHFKKTSEALSSQKYDAVVVAAPPHVHKEIATEVIKKKTKLFIEKPLGMHADGWEKLHQECEKNNLISYIGYCHKFIPYTTKLKQLMEKKIIGDVVHATMRWGSYLPDWHSWEDYKDFYMSKKDQGGGALMDESHGIDLVRFIIGEIDKVGAMVDNTSDLKMTSDDIALLILKMKNKSLDQINFDLSSRAPRVNFEIAGKVGIIIWDRVENNLKIYTADTKKWELIKTVLPQHTDHAGVMWHGSYLNFLEEGRIDALDKVGLSYSKLSRNGFEIPVISIQMKYRKSFIHGE